MTKRTRGTGSVYLRGNTYWIQFCVDGHPVRESAETDSKPAAEGKLRQRLTAIEKGQFKGLAAEKQTVGDMVKRLFDRKESGELGKAKSLDWDKARWAGHLEPVFGHMKARAVTDDRLTAYIKRRKAEDAAPATINRELALLRHAFKVSKAAGPTFPHLAEDNVRQGFLELDEFPKLAEECAKEEGLWLRALLEIAWDTGMRKGEMVGHYGKKKTDGTPRDWVGGLRVGQVDLSTGRVRLEGRDTKTGRPRGFTLTKNALPLITALCHGKQDDDFVITRPDGQPIKDFRKTWANVCKRAGKPGLLIHDMRRSAGKRMVEAGVPDAAIMRTAGWLTRSMFDRYCVGSEREQDDVARKLEALDSRPAAIDTIMTQPAPKTVQRPN